MKNILLLIMCSTSVSAMNIMVTNHTDTPVWLHQKRFTLKNNKALRKSLVLPHSTKRIRGSNPSLPRFTYYIEISGANAKKIAIPMSQHEKLYAEDCLVIQEHENKYSITRVTIQDCFALSVVEKNTIYSSNAQ